MKRRAIATAIALAAATGCATKTPDPDAVLSADALTIAPFAIHEACVKLAPGDRLDWRFEASAPVAFNIHYHDGPSVVMPITRDAGGGDSGVFHATLAHDYCATWEAGALSALISYRVRPLRSGR